MMNRFTTALASFCREHLLDEKWLVAPSLRVGHQWLVVVARSGQPAVNCHVKTLTSLALELAGPQMAATGVEFISTRGAVMLIDQIVQRLGRTGRGYLRQLPSSAGLAQAVAAAIDALRRAGLQPGQLRPDHFEADIKGHELAEVLEAYVKELREKNLVDRAAVFHMAIDRLQRDGDRLPGDALVLVPEDPEDMVCAGLERALRDALPASRKQTLPVDRAGDLAVEPRETLTDISLLRQWSTPSEAPPPVRDGSVSIVRAIGEGNEVREVLRRCLAAGYPLDEVELLYTDSDTYVPILYETLARLQSEMNNLDEPPEPPVTFLEGIPARQFRPGRALVAWLAWMRDDCPQQALGQMIRDGLLVIPGRENDAVSFSWLADVFRGIGIGFGRDCYLPALNRHIAGLELRIADGEQHADEEGEVESGRASGLQRRLCASRLLRGLVEELLVVSPEPGARPQQILAAAQQFLETHARHQGRMDNYARRMLLDQIDDMKTWLERTDQAVGQRMEDWLAALPDEAWVGGSGPRGGCLHVAHVSTGGHSGRPHTFIVGLDDGRFPGAGLQDPVLLDSERRKLSNELPTAARRLKEKLEQFVLLLARLRGTVTLSYSCHDLADDRDMFPSPVLLSAFRILSGNHEGDQADLLHWLMPAASFAPRHAEQALDASEWWLWRLSGPQAVTEPRALLAHHFPHLGRGFEAGRQRASDAFTSYDGWITGGGAAIDPTAAHGPVVSASQLELLGACPLAYFFKYVLGIDVPDELEIDPDRWLDPLMLGSLLHTVFERFLRQLVERGELPQYQRDEARLLEILQEEIDAARKLIPAPSEEVLRRQCRQLEKTVRIFLREEERFCRRDGSRPLYLEASIGMKADGPGTPFDTPDPVQVRLPNGGHIRARGRIDRIDQVGDAAHHTVAIWDYKTGSSWKYRQSPPFWKGRVVQHVLYLEMVRARLEALGSPFSAAQLRQFGFFFPGARNSGERIVFTPEELADGGRILELLARVAASGSFLATNDSQHDCTYCAYREICGNVEAVAAASRRKLDNPNNSALQPFLELRSHGQG